MFYAHFVLAKKGPLARIWLAAHWDKKLTKAHVFETNIESSVEGILQPKVKMALRTSGHLLLGIVRIYSRKAKYLLADCNEAFIKIKMAFRPGVVDLPEGNREAAVATITLPEVFHDFDSAMPDIANIEVDATVTLNQSRAEDITLKEDYGTLNLIGDDNFGDMGFDDPEMARDATNIDEGFDHASLLLGEDKTCMISKDDQVASTSQHSFDETAPSRPKTPRRDPENVFSREDIDANILEAEGAGLFEPGGLFDDAPLGHVPMDTTENAAVLNAPNIAENRDESDDDDMYDMGPASMGCPSGPSSPESVVAPDERLPEPGASTSAVPQNEQAPVSLGAVPGSEMPTTSMAFGDDPLGLMPPPEMPPPPPLPLQTQPELPVEPVPSVNQTTLIHNDEESFALAPLDASALLAGGMERAKAKRKRKLIVDEVKNISGEEMKSQLSDTSDIVTTLDLAPPTKRLMHWKETGGVEKLFALPGRPMLSKVVNKLYQRHLTTRPVENEERIDEDRLDVEESMEKNREEDVSEAVAPAAAAPPPSKRRRMIGDESLVVEPPQAMLPPAQAMLPPPQAMLPPPPPHVIHNPMEAAMDLIPDHSALGVAPNLMMPPNLEIPGLPNLPHPAELQEPLHLSLDSMIPPPPMPLESPQPDQLPMPSPRIPAIPVQDSLTDAFMFPQQEEPNLQQALADQSMNEKPVVPEIVPEQQEPQPETSALHELVDAANIVGKDDVEPQLNQDESLPNHKFIPFIPEPVDPRDELFNQQLLSGPQNNLLQSQPVLHQEENHINQFVYDDDDDYAAPASVGVPDEQGADETYEQFEERIINKRTAHMLHMIRNQMEKEATVKFSDLVRHNKRKQVAQKFYTFLVLKKQQALELQQDEPYGELLITRGPKYETFC